MGDADVFRIMPRETAELCLLVLAFLALIFWPVAR